MYVDINDGLYNQIFEKDGYVHLQIDLDKKSLKFDDEGDRGKIISMYKLKS